MFDSLMVLTDYALFVASLFILLGSIFLTFKLRFVQLRLFPALFKMLKASFLKKEGDQQYTVLPHKALLTAMSTTLGISTIVAPFIAISLGGPGALLGFLLTAFFGSAATYTEVSLCIQHRKKLENGMVMGGPMQYLKHIFSPAAAKWYAILCLTLMIAWSAAQANQVVAVLDSPLLGNYRIPTLVSGLLISVLILLTSMGGIKRISQLSAKLVPLMFFLYIGSCLWIILSNVDQLGTIFGEIFTSALKPISLASGTILGGIVSALRWGIFKGIQTTEAGVGTQAIPHSSAETKDPMEQATLSMLSTYTAGFIAFLSGCVALITKTWQNPDLPLGISMVAASFEQYFSIFGIGIVAISTLLFGFGTILGNSYNGSQCFIFLTDNKKLLTYLIASAIIIFVGSVADAKVIWSSVDFFLAPLAIFHIFALVLYTHRQPKTVLSEAK